MASMASMECLDKREPRSLGDALRWRSLWSREVLSGVSRGAGAGRRMVLAVLFGLAGWLGVAGDSFGQLTIPTSVVTSQNLTTPQREQMNRFIVGMTAKLNQADRLEISDARKQLIAQFSRVQADTGKAFLQAYSAAIVPKLAGMVSPNQPMLTRLNAMIVFERVTGTILQIDKQIVDVLIAGLGDEGAAVRYWAAKATANLKGKIPAAKNLQAALLNRLGGLSAEKDDLVYQTLLTCLIELSDLRGATQLMLDELVLRVTAYVENPDLSPSPITVSLRQLFQSVVSANAGGQQTNQAVITQITTVAFKYFQLSALLLERQKVTGPALQKSYIDLLNTTEQVLRWGADQLVEGGANKPQQIERAIQRKQWREVVLRATEWKALLLGLKFPADDLDVKI